ncbi:hypothetical protein RB213_011926 [Colletotrichum asianum]
MLTICTSSKTLEVAQVTQMMWFLYPTSFLWAKNLGGTAYDVMEMTKKIEHKGYSNHMLRKLS